MAAQLTRISGRAFLSLAECIACAISSFPVPDSPTINTLESVGAKWSEDLKDYAGTCSCVLPHVALVLSGTLKVVMDDGAEEEFSKNDVMLLPPGHDAWSVGDVPCTFIEFSRGNDYYEEH